MPCVRCFAAPKDSRKARCQHAASIDEVLCAAVYMTLEAGVCALEHRRHGAWRQLRSGSRGQAGQTARPDGDARRRVAGARQVEAPERTDSAPFDVFDCERKVDESLVSCARVLEDKSHHINRASSGNNIRASAGDDGEAPSRSNTADSAGGGGWWCGIDRVGQERAFVHSPYYAVGW